MSDRKTVQIAPNALALPKATRPAGANQTRRKPLSTKRLAAGARKTLRAALKARETTANKASSSLLDAAREFFAKESNASTDQAELPKINVAWTEVAPEPKQGVLKNGRLPTIRAAKRATLLEKSESTTSECKNPASGSVNRPTTPLAADPVSILSSNPGPSPHAQRKSNEAPSRDAFESPDIVSEPPDVSSESPRVVSGTPSTKQVRSATGEARSNAKSLRRSARRTRRMRLGRLDRKIGVLINGRSTRRAIESELAELELTPMSKVRSDLKKKGLLKTGSTASNEVLRELYKKSTLAGEISNVSSKSMMHNYLSTDS